MNFLSERDNQQIPENIFHKVLLPYQENKTKYLKKATMINLEKKESGLLTIIGDFEILNSCYIDSTGHFNAVEFTICFNQLAYVLFGYVFFNDLFKYFPIRNYNT